MQIVELSANNYNIASTKWLVNAKEKAKNQLNLILTIIL